MGDEKMNYKVAIDPGNGGSDSGYVLNGIVEKDYNLLISNYIKERLDTLGVPNIITRNTDRYLSDDERRNIIESSFGNDGNVIVISNNLNKGGESGVEIVYALKDNDSFPSVLANNFEQAGIIVNKYYQLRDLNETFSDYYPIIKNTPNYKTVLILYGYVDNKNDVNKIRNNYKDYGEAVVKAITEYIGVKYIPISDDYYVVKKGDTLWKIAINNGVSVDELKRVNNLTSNFLNIGQVLYIPGVNIINDNLYIVKSGDTLWKIAKDNGVSVDELKRVNNLASNILSIGQRLIIPNTVSYNTYVVKSGDTLWNIAKNNGLSVDELKRVNNLTSNILSIGQKLVIPN